MNFLARSAAVGWSAESVGNIPKTMPATSATSGKYFSKFMIAFLKWNTTSGRAGLRE